MSRNIEDITIDSRDITNEMGRRFSLGQLKPKQMEAIIAFVEGRDVFVSLPTGYGKSIIYALLPLIFDSLKGNLIFCELYTSIFVFYTDCSGSLVVCISPLISIMMDQRAKFTTLGLKTEYVGAAQEDPGVIRQVLAGNVQLLFMSPESILNNKHFRGMLLSQHYKKYLVAVAVDEAHCVKSWYVVRTCILYCFNLPF